MGAWIETDEQITKRQYFNVAPYVGAWIETHIKIKAELKLSVAPYVGAWIETKRSVDRHSSLKSHPTWVRGLKL